MIQSKPLLDPVFRLGPTPPLEAGDHLTRTEFERRYDAMPALKKAELIEGVVSMGSPVRWEQHARPHGLVLAWLIFYSTSTPDTSVGDNASIRLDGDNMPQSDVAMIIASDKGGQARLSEDGYVEGAPELIAEIAATTASIDLNTKLRVYRRNNVLEYIVWRVLEGAIDWFRLEQGEYQRLVPGADGIIRSVVFPGLWLDPVGLIRLDFARVLAVVQQGLADPTYQAFAARLKA